MFDQSYVIRCLTQYSATPATSSTLPDLLCLLRIFVESTILLLPSSLLIILVLCFSSSLVLSFSLVVLVPASRSNSNVMLRCFMLLYESKIVQESSVVAQDVQHTLYIPAGRFLVPLPSLLKELESDNKYSANRSGSGRIVANVTTSNQHR